jgi:hypothetical protein
VHRVTFVPFVVEATGRLGSDALGLLDQLAVVGNAKRRFVEELSVHLARYNGLMMVKVRSATIGSLRERGAPEL